MHALRSVANNRRLILLHHCVEGYDSENDDQKWKFDASL
jgi:hypothetical protein